MTFGGEVLSVAELIDGSARHSTASIGAAPAPPRHTASGNASAAAEMTRAGAPLSDGWRFGVLQTLDDYESAVRRGGVEFGASMFAEEPAPTGSVELDAAFAAVAEYLAERDGWTPPDWAFTPSRHTPPWYASVPKIFHDEADRESPSAFRERGIFVTIRSLSRA